MLAFLLGCIMKLYTSAHASVWAWWRDYARATSFCNLFMCMCVYIFIIYLFFNLEPLYLQIFFHCQCLCSILWLMLAFFYYAALAYTEKDAVWMMGCFGLFWYCSDIGLFCCSRDLGTLGIFVEVYETHRCAMDTEKYCLLLEFSRPEVCMLYMCVCVCCCRPVCFFFFFFFVLLSLLFFIYLYTPHCGQDA